jgi:tRNA(Ile)-lysidine synthase
VGNLPERIEESIRVRRLFKDGEPVLVAVSGGLDSMVLLHVLARLAQSHRWGLVVAHFNHQLRGRSSDADERFVRQAAKNLGLSFMADRADVGAHAATRGISIEMAARELRHDFLARAAVKSGIRVMALAHHADDQVELFFLRLLRGAGAEGLSGMKWRNASPAHSGITLARPLLSEKKSSLRAWATREKIHFREDASNAKLQIRRNRVRHELLPLLEKKYQPALAPVILRQMDIFGAEGEFVELAARKWLESKRRKIFSALPVALQRRCLQIQLARQGVPANFELIEQLRAFEDRPVVVRDDMAIFRDAAGVVRTQLAREPGFILGHLRRRLRGSAGEIMFEKMRLLWEIMPLPAGTVHASKTGVNCEYYDADKVGMAIELRHWRPGDRFQPIGMGSAVKLQDIFTNRKVPRAERHRLIVAATAAGELFWVEGLRLGELFKLDKNTVRGLKWCWERV